MKKKTPQEVGVIAGVEGKLEVKVAHSAQDWRRAKEALGREHGLGAGSEAGDRLCQLVLEEGKLAGVLVWCAAAWHLKDRDEAGCDRGEKKINKRPPNGSNTAVKKTTPQNIGGTDNCLAGRLMRVSFYC